jgi:hypothetical protein
MVSLLKAVFGGKKTLEQYRKERSEKNRAINSVDGVAKPTQRRIVLNKSANTRFGADLCRIAGRIFVLKVDETKVNDEFGEYLPAMRAGLSRFDEIIQIEEQDVSRFALPEIYQYLQETRRINITVADRPLLRSYSITHGDSAESLRTALAAAGAHKDVVYTTSDTSIPAGEALVEIKGELVLGVPLDQLEIVLDYAVDKCEDTESFQVSTLPVEVAASFLSAYIETTAVFGSKDWKANELVRKSIRHSKRRSSFSGQLRSSVNNKSSIRRNSMRSATAVGSEYSDLDVNAQRRSFRSATNLDRETIERARRMMEA